MVLEKTNKDLKVMHSNAHVFIKAAISVSVGILATGILITLMSFFMAKFKKINFKEAFNDNYASLGYLFIFAFTLFI